MKKNGECGEVQPDGQSGEKCLFTQKEFAHWIALDMQGLILNTFCQH